MSSDDSTWYLEGFLGGGEQELRIDLQPLPFLVGRRPEVQLRLSELQISGFHARFELRDGDLWLVDTGSRNGTFVNGERLEPDRRLEAGDLIHFVRREFRLASRRGELEPFLTRQLEEDDLVLDWARYARELEERIDRREVAARFQPVVELATGSTIGFEVLGKVPLADGAVPLQEVFRLAARSGRVEALSAAFRRRGVEDARALPSELALFLNTHPFELGDPDRLLGSLTPLREVEPRRPLVLEIHEGAATDLESLRSLAAALGGLGFEIAYDDFGRGYDRLAALAATDPGFVKFDRQLIHEVDVASARRREIVARLVDLAQELDIRPLAEGIETGAELAACRELGFTHGQGYLLGRPAAMDQILASLPPGDGETA